MNKAALLLGILEITKTSEDENKMPFTIFPPSDLVETKNISPSPPRAFGPKDQRFKRVGGKVGKGQR